MDRFRGPSTSSTMAQRSPLTRMTGHCSQTALRGSDISTSAAILARPQLMHRPPVFWTSYPSSRRAGCPCPMARAALTREA
eukprot:9485022-Alexandrium_andersonii.AAC.1